MKNDSRIILTFDEFFKICSKTFFEEEGFRVETELEIFKLPKRLDKKANWIDRLKMIIHDRIVAFEKDPKIRRKYMATAYESDITDLVKPHLDKAREEGLGKGCGHSQDVEFLFNVWYEVIECAFETIV